MSTRRICIGTVYRDGFCVSRGRLQPFKCLSVNWRGVTDWCQPWQFVDEDGLRCGVSTRLALAGLQLLDMTIGHGDYAPIECRVARLRSPHCRAARVNRMRQRWNAEGMAHAENV